MELRLLLTFIVCLAIASASAQTPARVLIYTRTTGFRHDSIPTAVEALQAKASSVNMIFDHTEDPAKFSDETLAGYDVLLFLSTTGEVLDANGKTAFQKYLNFGGNFVAIHSASDTLRNDMFYELELGALFDYHPPLQNATVDVIDDTHPSTSMLPSEWRVMDEMYNFQSDPRDIGATVVLAANESSYIDNGNRTFNQGQPHPLAWFQTHGAGVEGGKTAGRSFYTSLGHLNETWQDELFLSHVLGGIMWTLQSNTTRATNTSALVGNQASQTTSQIIISSSQTLTSPMTAETTSSSSGAVKVMANCITGIQVVTVSLLLADIIQATLL